MISIIVPVYNAGVYLQKCIESVLMQSYRDWELILIDDGSNDGSKEKCLKYSEMDNRIKVLFSDRGGVSSARNLGLDEARGEWLMFLDNDDYWKELQLLDNIYKKISTDKYDIVLFPVTTFWPNGKEITENQNIDKKRIEIDNKADAINYMIKQRILNCAVWDKVIRREIIEKYKIRFPEGKRNEDIYVTGKLLLNAATFGWCDNATYMYRKGTGTSQSEQRVTRKTTEELMCICIDFIEEIKEMNIEDSLKSVYYSYIARPYGVLMMYISTLDSRDSLIKSIKPYDWILDYGKQREVKILKTAKNFVGFENTIKLLSICKR